MPDLRYQMIEWILRSLSASRLDRICRGFAAGSGVILTFHQVRAVSDRLFAENRGLEITPRFLEATIRLLHAEGYEIIPINALRARLDAPDPKHPFAVLTFDDGYIDNRDYALPILKRYNAPFTMFVTPGFAERTSPLWWLDLEDAVRVLDRIEVALPGGQLVHPTVTPEEKRAGFKRLYWRLRGLDEYQARHIVADLAVKAGIDTLGRLDRLCLDWDGLRAMAREPLVTIGAHSVTHPRLATLPEADARWEIKESKARAEKELGQEVRHFAYPVGDARAAGRREFDLARAAGFETGVTTRPGVLFSGHANHRHALPRLSVNGLFQRPDELRALLFGLPSLLNNRGRRLDIG